MQRTYADRFPASRSQISERAGWIMTPAREGGWRLMERTTATSFDVVDTFPTREAAKAFVEGLQGDVWSWKDTARMSAAFPIEAPFAEKCHGCDTQCDTETSHTQPVSGLVFCQDCWDRMH